MSLSHSVEPGHQGELDPLLEFNAELSAPESPVKPFNPPSTVAAAESESAEPLRQRLEQAERSLDRALIEITSLKSDLATLVTAVDDIKKRLTRRPKMVLAPATTPVRHRALGKVPAIVILVLTLGVAIGGLASAVLTEAPDPPQVQIDFTAPQALEPLAVVPTAGVELAAGRASVRGPAPVEPARPGAFVGTLAIDATPAGEVFIDRQAAGRTPLRAENLRAGSHLIWIERAGYHRWTRVVTVPADRVTRVRADLDPLGR